MTKPKQTSSAVSSIAGRYARKTNAQFFSLVRLFALQHGAGNDDDAKAFFRDFRKVCASALVQDQTKGQK
jgi:hypothetical protein